MACKHSHLEVLSRRDYSLFPVRLSDFSYLSPDGPFSSTKPKSLLHQITKVGNLIQAALVGGSAIVNISNLVQQQTFAGRVYLHREVGYPQKPCRLRVETDTALSLSLFGNLVSHLTHHTTRQESEAEHANSLGSPLKSYKTVEIVGPTLLPLH
jgi:hypothetical protein